MVLNKNKYIRNSLKAYDKVVSGDNFSASKPSDGVRFSKASRMALHSTFKAFDAFRARCWERNRNKVYI